MAYGYVIEAEYESGYVHREDEQDHSPYQPGRNIFFDIINGLPTKAGHGRMTSFRLISTTDDVAYVVDWTSLPENARPIYFRRMTRTINRADVNGNFVDDGPECQMHGFGFQYTDENGENVQKIEEII